MSTAGNGYRSVECRMGEHALCSEAVPPSAPVSGVVYLDCACGCPEDRAKRTRAERVRAVEPQ